MLARVSRPLARDAGCWVRRTSGRAAGELDCDQMERDYLVRNYWADGVRNKAGLCFVRGRGVHLVDREGRHYLDFAAGIAVNSIGHSHPMWVSRIAAQAATLAHTSNLFHSEPPLKLAKRLVELSCFDKVFFSNSGTEANEAALKFARRYHLGAAAGGPATCAFQDGKRDSCRSSGGACDCWEDRGSERDTFVAFVHGFHGRSSGALSLTHKPAIRAPFSPLLGGDVEFLPFNDTAAFRELMRAKGGRVAAVMVEPVQGEGGIRPSTPEFMRAVRDECTAAGALMIADEVQCGLARTGRLWGHEAYGVEPDMMTLAKPLAGGLPIGATLVKDHVAAAIRPGDHGSTFAGNPLCTAAAGAVLSILGREGALEHVRSVGQELYNGLVGLKEAHPALVTDVRAPLDFGLMQAMDLTVPASDVTARALDRGVVFITAGPKTLRFVPPLIVESQHVRQALDTLESVLAELAA